MINKENEKILENVKLKISISNFDEEENLEMKKNNRNILYCDMINFTEEEINYIRNNARHGNKLPENLHLNININLDDVDEIIEG